MPRKKTNYEKKGFVRQLADSLFTSKKEKNLVSKWRPRKTQFERLDPDEDEFENNDVINRAFSTESEPGEYRSSFHFEKKKAVLQKSRNNKRDLSSMALQPSVRDKKSSRSTPSKRVKKQQKEKLERLKLKVDPFESDPFASFKSSVRRRSDASETMSKQTTSTRQTTTSKQTALTAFHSVHSDPTNFFSQPQPARLTRTNLEAMAAMSAGLTQTFSHDGIENINPRSEFHQFTVDEDKESTVIFPVEAPNEPGPNLLDEEEAYNDDYSQTSYTSKGTQIQRQSRGFFNLSPESKKDGFQKKDPIAFTSFPDAFSQNEPDSFLEKKRGSDFGIFGMTAQEIDPRKDPPLRMQSTHSLAYSESSAGVSYATGKSSRRSIQELVEKFEQNRPIQGRSEREPLSPLNVFRDQSPSLNVSADKKLGKRSLRGKHHEIYNKPDPDADWSVFGESFDKKPDPTGNNPKSRPSVSANIVVHGAENVMNPVIIQDDENDFKPRLSFTSKSDFGMDISGSNMKGKIPSEMMAQPKLSNKGFGGNKSIPEDSVVAGDHDDEITLASFRMTPAMISERPIGIQTLPSAISRSFSSSSSVSSGKVRSKGSRSSRSRSSRSRSSRSRHDKSLKSFFTGITMPISEDEDSMGHHSISSSSASYNKPTGLPGNAIMASMLFQRKYNIDKNEVQAKLEATEREYSQYDKKRGDIPQSINANEDTYSIVSAFTEDTTQIDTWRKPTRDLLEHFARNRQTDFDFKRHMEKQRAKAKALFEA